jgi:hypothetical protein
MAEVEAAGRFRGGRKTLHNRGKDVARYISSSYSHTTGSFDSHDFHNAGIGKPRDWNDMSSPIL